MTNSQPLNLISQTNALAPIPNPSHLIIAAVRGNPTLVRSISKSLSHPLIPLDIKNFADGEIYVRFGHSIRGKTVFIIQSFGDREVNKRLMESIFLVEAAKGASAERVIVIFPYYPYSRQDRKPWGREPVSARVVSRILESVGVDRLASLDLHSPQIQGFASVPFDCGSAMPLLAKFVRQRFELVNAIVVSPDAGGVSRARQFAEHLGNSSPLAIIDKHRREHNQAQVLEVIGDVGGKTALIVDDIIDTADTICEAARALKQRGAEKVIVIATHGLFSQNAKERLNNSLIEQIIVTDTLSISEEKRPACLCVVSVSQLLGDIIHRIYHKESVSALLSRVE